MATHETPQPLSENMTRGSAPANSGLVGVGRSMCLLLLAVSLGCAHTRPSPLSDTTKAQLGTIAVAMTAVSPEVDYRTPGRDGAGGAAVGAAKGVGLGVLGGSVCFLTLGRYLPACGVAVATPYFMVRYAVDQATEGIPGETTAACETSIKTVLTAPKHPALARDQVFRLAAAHTRQTVVLLPDPGPLVPSDAPSYHRLADHGIDTVLEIAIQRIALHHRDDATGGIRDKRIWRINAAELNPYLTLVVTARRRVVRTADGTTLYDYTGDHHGRRATFTDWGANDAQLLQEGLAQLFREIAGEIVSQVFGVTVPPPIEPPAPAAPNPEPEPQVPSLRDEAERPAV